MIFDKNRSKLKNGMIVIGVAVIAILLVWGAGMLFYSSHFLPGSFISNVNVSNMDIANAKSAIETENEGYALQIDEGDSIESISSDDIKYTIDSSPADIMLSEQPSASWFISVLLGRTQEMSAPVSYDESALASRVSSLSCASPNRTLPKNAGIALSGGEFKIVPEEEGDAVDITKLVEACKEAIDSNNAVLSLSDAACYLSPKWTSSSPEVIAACSTANRFLSARVSYTIDGVQDAVTVDSASIAPWVHIDEETMSVTLDETQIKSYLRALGTTWDTVGDERSGKNPDGRSWTVSGGTYGWEIDEDAEFTALIGDLNDANTVSRDILYVQTAAGPKGSEWGSTYIDLDIAEQHIWYIDNGTVRFETDVVTGLPTPQKETTPGIWSILEKQSPYTMTGDIVPSTGKPEYITPCSYWMRMTWSGIGFHDAIWQPSFGGDAYTWRGSHGCINMSLDDAATLYSMVSVGCPVIAHG